MNEHPIKLFGDGDLPKINKGQEALFCLVSRKLKEQKKVEYDELMEIYLYNVQMCSLRSEAVWDSKTGKYSYEGRPYRDFEIEQMMQSWLLRALGTLIKKGYLMVIPRMEFTKKQEAGVLR
jgi:hypothetical protein